MKKLVLLFSVAGLLLGCSVDNEPAYSYTTAIRNVSDHPFHILVLGSGAYNTPLYDTLINEIVNPNTYIFKKSYMDTHFSGMVNTVDDGLSSTPYTYRYEFRYMKIVFIENGKGYICQKNSTDINSELCFQYKASLVGMYSTGDFFLEEDGIYYYDITPYEYEKAHELP